MRHKFTNAYRAADRVSQFLIRHVIYKGDQSAEEVFFRIMIFKMFNKIETWQLLEANLREVSYSHYDREAFETILNGRISKGITIFSAAYVMPSGVSSYGSPRKHGNCLSLIEQMMADRLPSHLVETGSMRDAFSLLRAYPMIGDFLALQYVTDLNYSELTSFSEMDFVVPGPGAISGIRKCFEHPGEYDPADIIRMAADQQAEEFSRRSLPFESLWGRDLQLIDCQNLFCETDKYARVAHPNVEGVGARRRIKQAFRATSDPVDYWFPPKWGINDAVQRSKPIVTATPSG